MYLKRLELLGFKSFPNKTILKLTPGITSIVGPNGCGKTNILDAIRWVLGEQKVSLLRGSKMDEVIFNGTRDTKPLGMAEVTLVVHNNKGILPTEYSEIQIARRLFRSGESEYLLNKVPCRLRDITDLFMDTGVGAHVYSVIQQEMIEAILSDRAEERRFLFEEAAGISKYKSRKNAALRKLEATEGDLIRLKDIVAEVDTQVNSLRRQMNKTQRYKNLSEELRSWEIFLSKTAADELYREQRELMAERDIHIDARVKSDTEIDLLSARQEEERKTLTELERQLSEISSEIFAESEEGHAIEKEITVLRERRENAKQLKEKNSLDIEAFKKRQAILLEQVEATKEELAKVDDDLSRLQEDITLSEKKLTAADEEVLSARQAREELNRKLADIEGQLSAGRSDDTNLKEQENEITSALSNLERLYDESGEKKKDLIGRLAKGEKELTHLKERTIDTQTRRSSTEDKIESLDKELDEAAGRIYELSASLEAAEARRHLLSEMVTHFEGYGSGVAAAMENRDRWPGLIGTVADSLTPQSGFEDAIEAALGEAAGFMICQDRKTAEEIIEYLKSEKKGRAGLLIMDDAGFDSNTTRPDVSSDNFIGWADEFISIPENLKTMASLLLSRVAVIEPENAIDVLDKLPAYFSVVTTDGKLLSGKAIISGGSREGLSLLGRKEKIVEQKQAIEKLTDEIERFKKSRNEITTTLGLEQADLRSIITELETRKEDTEQNEKDLAALRFEVQAEDRELNRIEKEREEFSVKLKALKDRLHSLNLSYDQLCKEKDRLVELSNQHDADIEDLERKSGGAESRFSNLQMDQVETKSRRQQLESQIKHTRELISEIESNVVRKSTEISQTRSDVGSVDERINQLETKLKETFNARAGIIDRQTRIQQEHSTLQGVLADREKDIKSLRRSRDDANTKLHTVEIRITEVESEAKNIRQKIKEEYDLDLDGVSTEPPNAGISHEEREQRVRALREQLKDFGAVNLLALDEYETAKERQAFMTAQMDDLLKAKSTLQSTIKKINQTARKLFMETFNNVGENFRQVFEELFTGGEAEIRLVDVEDPLESPIEIIARPGGKKLLSIAQMSGGEKALTAISLLFAIYLVKPSPFCILDEIDAPLDDANVHRFLKIIRAFSEQTQFVIITHNKITMEVADILYGITMEQPGISEVVSVRFHDDEEGRLIDTSIGEHRVPDNVEVPAAVRDRITPRINVGSRDNLDSE